MTVQPAPCHAAADDDARLRRDLRDALARAPADAPEALQAKLLLQWRQRHDSAHAVGAVAALQLGWRRHPALAGGALLALAVAAVLWFASARDPGADELQQIDVLTLMSMGEL